MTARKFLYEPPDHLEVRQTANGERPRDVRDVTVAACIPSFIHSALACVTYFIQLCSHGSYRFYDVCS